jgi:hypothetical protein
VLWGAFANEQSSGFATTWSKVDDVVYALNQLTMVLNHDDRVPRHDKALKDSCEQCDVSHM